MSWPLWFYYVEGAENGLREVRPIRHKDGVPTSNFLGSSPYVKLVHSPSELDIKGGRMGRHIEHRLTGNLIPIAEDECRSISTHLLIDGADLRAEICPSSEAPGQIELARKRQADRGKCVRKVTNGAEEKPGQ